MAKNDKQQAQAEDQDEAAPLVPPTPPPPSPAEAALQQQLDAANAKLTALGSLNTEMEVAVRRKMQAGLTREQAVIAVRCQTAHDAVLALTGLSDSEMQQKMIEAASIT